VKNGKGGFGFDAAKEVYVDDMQEAGIIDPTKVARTALQNAASVAALLLTTDCMIAEKPKEKGAGMPGMPPAAWRHGRHVLRARPAQDIYRGTSSPPIFLAPFPHPHLLSALKSGPQRSITEFRLIVTRLAAQRQLCIEVHLPFCDFAHHEALPRHFKAFNHVEFVQNSAG